MDLHLAGKIGVVTGANRGISRVIAQVLAAEGVQLALAARSREPLEELARSQPAASLVHAADLGDQAASEKLVAATVPRFGRLDLRKVTHFLRSSL